MVERIWQSMTPIKDVIRCVQSILVILTLCFSGTIVAMTVTPREVLFKARPTSSKAAAAVAGISEITPLLHVQGHSKPALGGQIYKATLSPTASMPQVLRNLRSRPGILYAQPNHVFHTFQVPNDPRVTDQLHLDLISWPALRAVLPSKEKDVIVGIIDSGIDRDHEDLAAHVWTNSVELAGRPGVDDDRNGYVDDVYGWDFTDAPTLPGQGDYVAPDNDPSDESSHGTQVAGIIGAVADNGVGIAGVADARLMAIRAGLNFDQGGTFLQEDDLAAAILYAVDNGADILNLSWGSFDRAFVIEDAVRYAVERGVVVVAAAGNAGQAPVAYPAALPGVISVGATETSGQLASFSSFGQTLDLVAPGVNIFSTRLDDTYGPRSGSSFAAPQVAGLAALLLSRQPDLNSEQIRGALVASASDLGELGWDRMSGAGQANAEELIPYVTGIRVSTTARIIVPGSDLEVAGTGTVIAAGSGPNTLGYRLSWSPNTEVPMWTTIAEGTSVENIEQPWSVPSDLADSAVVLRLEIKSSDVSRPIEHRVRLRANPLQPEMTSLFFGPILTGRAISWRIRWVTQRPSFGSAILSDGFVQDTIRTNKLDRFHEAVIPDPTIAQILTFQIWMRSPSGLQALTSPESIPVVPARIPTIGFSEIANLPDGFLPDRVSDFDGDGRPEIALMPYVEGLAFSPVEINEFSEDRFTQAHTTLDAFLPWNVGDVNHDGRPDLLASSVARIRLLSGSPFPTTIVEDRSGVWGGEIGDADGDGATEILARSTVDHTIRVIRFQEGGEFEEVASLVDFSEGIGEMGSRFVVTDFDGDFRQDLIVGDADGDVWSYEFDGDGYSPSILLPGDDDTDARIIGGGMDLDGDGQNELVVARAFPNGDDPLNGWWDLEIYESAAHNQLQLEWVQRISGVTTPGNGISLGDLDGDGSPELAVALIPDLYVIKGDGPDLYRPIYHTNIALTYRPLISDLDDDGAMEIGVNKGGRIQILERDLPTDTAQRPEFVEAIQIVGDRISLAWMPTPSAENYRLTRSLNDGPAAEVTSSPAQTYVDEGVTKGDHVRYVVEAIAGIEAIQSSPVELFVDGLPEITGAERLDDSRLAIQYSKPMSIEAADPNGYRLTPPGIVPTSGIRDQGNRRVVLTFETAILDGTTYTIEARSASDLAGSLVAPGSRSVSFTPGATSTAATADFDGSGTVGFPDFLMFAVAFGGTDSTFDLDDDGTVGFSDFLMFAALFGQAA